MLNKKAAAHNAVFFEILIGIIYVMIGYSILRLLERQSMVSGALDSL
jgi:hypothetical protein